MPEYYFRVTEKGMIINEKEIDAEDDFRAAKKADAFSKTLKGRTHNTRIIVLKKVGEIDFYGG